MNRPMKVHQQIVNQRPEEALPRWVGRERGSGIVDDEGGGQVHVSGKRRHVAGLIVGLLDTASEMAVLSTFLLADSQIEDALLRASKRGVRVYVMLASEARLGREERSGEFDRRVVEEHKRMLERLAGHVLFRSAPHFHAKVVVVDPQSHARGILLTANLTREALERNEELAVELTPSEAKETGKLLRWAMWETAEHEMLDPTDRFRAVTPLGSVSPPAVTLPATTAERRVLRARALQLVSDARTRIIVASFGWDVDHPLVQRLIERAREGVEVVVLARKRDAAMPALARLCEAGATVYGFRWLHAKAIWSAEGALVMSANLQKEGLDHGFELGVELTANRADELHGRLQSWADGAQWKLENSPSSSEGSAKRW